MPKVVALCGRTFALEIPLVVSAPVISSLSPFQCRNGKTYDSIFIVEFTKTTIDLSDSIPRGNYFFREKDDVNFAILNHQFELSVSLSSQCARLTLSSIIDDPAGKIFHAFKWVVTIISIYDGGLPLHSSLVAENGFGMLFCGPSGKGKSTISSLITSEMPNLVRGSDELNVIFLDNESVVVHSTPFISSGGPGWLTAPIRLGKIFFLDQAADHRLAILTQKQIFGNLLKNIYHLPGNRFLTERMMDSVQHFSTLSNYNVLYFKKDKSIASYIRKNIESLNENET